MATDDVRGACGPGQAKRREENVLVWEGQARGRGSSEQGSWFGVKVQLHRRGGSGDAWWKS